MTDRSNYLHSEATQGDPALSPEQVRIVSLLVRDRDSLDPGPDLTDAVAEQSSRLLQPHPAISALDRDASSIDESNLCDRIFLSTVDLLPKTSRTTRSRLMERHDPVRRTRFTRRAGLLLAASLTVAFVVGGILLNKGIAPPPPSHVDVVIVDEPPSTDLVPGVEAIFIPISAGDDDLDDAINDATSMIAFSDLTLEDIESDLDAIERILQH